MINIWDNNYIPSKPIERAMKKFGRSFSKDQKILDIGCGFKPYQNFFNCEYIGIDPLPVTKPNVIGNAWDLPFDDNSFDGLVLNQALEHIAKTNKTIAEIKRVLKPGGRCIITVPQSMKNHSVPLPSTQAPVQNFNTTDIPYWHVDYYRYTKFGLIYLFQDFEIVSIQESNGYFSSLIQFKNYFLASLGLGHLFAPIYLVNNIIGIMKAYTTRVGAGPFPTELAGMEGDMLREQGAEYGARPSKKGLRGLGARKKNLPNNEN